MEFQESNFDPQELTEAIENGYSLEDPFELLFINEKFLTLLTIDQLFLLTSYYDIDSSRFREPSQYIKAILSIFN